MTGCRHGAKNTLLQNYLHLAERGGAEVHPLTTVTAIRALADGRYAVDAERTGAWVRPRSGARSSPRDVVLAAGTMGTQKLLHGMRDAGHLPNLSNRLGELTRTNSEAILGARAFRRDVDFSRGRCHHVVLPPRRPHPRRARALRQGQQRHGAAHHGAGRRRRSGPAAHLAVGGRAATR